MKTPRNHELKRLLALRKMNFRDLAEAIPGKASRVYVSQLLNGQRPYKREGADDARPVKLTRTWRLLQQILSAEEFECALKFANARRRELNLPELVVE